MELKEIAGSFKKNHKATTEKSTEKDEKILSPEITAKKIARIVDTGITNKNFEAMNSQLGKFEEENVSEERIFNDQSKLLDIILIIFAGLFIAISLIEISEAIFVIKYSNSFRQTVFIYVVGFIILCIVNIFIIYVCTKEFRFKKRYQKYYYLMKYKNVVLTDELSDYAKVSSKRVITDIKTAIKKKLIPQGYFGKNNRVIFLSNKQYLDYKNNYTAYNRYYEKLIEEYKRIGERPEEIQNLLDEGKEYINKIHEDNELIKDKEISNKLNEMEHTVTVIFREVDIDPDNAEKMGLLLNYYLPTTEKLLQTYIDLSEKESYGQNIEKAKREIISSLDTTNKAYQRILDGFFTAREMDISSDIKAMSIMMQKEGLINNGSADI